MFSGLNRENFALARRLGLRITTESNAAGPDFEEFLQQKLIRSDNTFNHCQDGLTGFGRASRIQARP